uniref:uncharacterized protein LOC122583539 n=1 Tax=Erigeron canadensis TaxID=72917 RepID=UPI001CB90F49|nr:uncharacterized protein LOC122583539 [Erigeron canadensis]
MKTNTRVRKDIIILAQSIENGNLNESDVLVWHDINGNESSFSSSSVWDTLRKRGELIPWVNMVWFPHAIPRHAFHIWLIFKRKLKTHDKMKVWDAGSATNLNLLCCSLCKKGPDSHDHLFFECSYSLQVWYSIRHLANMQHISERWDDITAWLIPISTSKSGYSVTGRLLVAALAYYIWQERNNRMFTNLERTPGQLKEAVESTVRLKLASMKFKQSQKTLRLLELWKLPKEQDMGG